MAKDEALKRYTKLVRAINDPEPLQNHITKSASGVSLKSTYLCLQCPSVNTYDERDQHDKAHKFCMSKDESTLMIANVQPGAESSSGSLYCRECQDFVHDATFEDIRLMRGRKRKHSTFMSDVDGKIIANNTAPPPCRALALRGLYNMGQTCFMSVVLQSLIHNPFIRAFYLSEGHRSSDCDRQACTSCALDDVFVEFHSTEKAEGYGMVAMLQASWKGGGSLAGYQQQDAHEYFQFTLDSLHTTNRDQSDKNHDSQSCTCIIHSTFGGVLQSTVTCSKCKNVTTAIDPFMDLSLDVKKDSSATVEKTKKKPPTSKEAAAAAAAATKDKSVSAIDLSECLDRFTAQETLPASEYTCRKCASAQSAVKRMSISRLPPVLPIHFKRFSHSKHAAKSVKLDTRVKFPTTLDMWPYCRLKDEDGRDNNGLRRRRSSTNTAHTVYQLSSVVVHHGKMDSGHYISYARVNDEWFMFDDSKVVLVDEGQVLGAEAYMLFYVVCEIDV